MLRTIHEKPRNLLLVAVILLVTPACSGGDPEATFTGTTCEYSGPETLQAGGFEMTFNNSSGEFAALAFLELPEDEEKRAEDLALIGSDGPIPAEPDPELAQPVGFMLAEPGEDVVEEVSLPSGDYVVDCATFEGDQPSHSWRAAAIEVER